MGTHAFLVSVIIPCYNAQQWIAKALQSVQSQTQVSLECIVVDDGSTDASADIVQRDFPWVKLIRTENGGPSRARNIGTQAASGNYLQYLDADDLLAPDKLYQQVTALEESGADVAYGDWQKLIKQPNGDYTLAEVVSRRIETEPEIALFTDFWCPPATYLFRRKIIDTIGGWHEGLSIIQDARFALDCALHGAEFLYRQGVMAHYRVHTSGSVSTNSPGKFIQDCFRNATEIQAWWEGRGGLNQMRRNALLKAYGHVARASYPIDRELFDLAYSAIRQLEPAYVPLGPWPLSVLAKLFGYPAAEAVALKYRQSKQLFQQVKLGSSIS